MKINCRGLLSIIVFFFSIQHNAPAHGSDGLDGNTAVSPKEKWEDFYDQGLKSYKNRAYQDALQLFLSAQETSIAFNLVQEELSVKFQLGKTYLKLSQNQEALSSLLEFLSADPTLIDADKKARANGYISRIYMKWGDYERAYNYRLNALEIFEAEQSPIGISRALYEIGTIRYYQKNYEEALDYYNRSQELAIREKDNLAMYSCLAAIGSVHEALNNLETALQYNKQSLSFAKTQNYREGIAYSLQNIGTNYFKIGEQAKALQLLEEAVDSFRTLDNKWNLAGGLLNLGEAQAESGDFVKALPNLNESLDITLETNNRTRRAEAYLALAHAFEKNGQSDQANSYYDSYISLKDSILNSETLEKMSHQKASYDIAQKEKKIELLEKEKEIGRLYNTILIGAAIFALIITIIIAFFNRSLQTANKTLEEKNKEIKAQNIEIQEKSEEIKAQNVQLEEYNQELKNFTYAVSHDLKAPVRQVGSFSSLFLRRYGNNLDDNAKEYLGFISAAVNRMEMLLKDLLSYATIGKHEEKSQVMESKTVVDIALSNLMHSIEHEEATVILDKASMPKIQGNQSQLIRLFQNIIGNALKYRSEAKPEIKIDITPNGTKNIFSIQDNGMGIAEEYKEKIFEMFGRLHKWEEIEGSGIGLASCKKIVEKHGGQIWVESEVGKGSTFYFSLPKLETA